MITIRQWQEINDLRSAESFGEVCEDWTTGDWGNALAGEVGELCNKIKKSRRGEFIDPAEYMEELGDIGAYLALVASELGIDLQEALAAEFNRVSKRIGSLYYIPE